MATLSKSGRGQGYKQMSGAKQNQVASGNLVLLCAHARYRRTRAARWAMRPSTSITNASRDVKPRTNPARSGPLPVAGIPTLIGVAVGSSISGGVVGKTTGVSIGSTTAPGVAVASGVVAAAVGLPSAGAGAVVA